MSNSIAGLNQAIQDSDIPEEAKAQLRGTFAQLQDSLSELASCYEALAHLEQIFDLNFCHQLEEDFLVTHEDQISPKLLTALNNDRSLLYFARYLQVTFKDQTPRKIADDYRYGRLHKGQSDLFELKDVYDKFWGFILEYEPLLNQIPQESSKIYMELLQSHCQYYYFELFDSTKNNY